MTEKQIQEADDMFTEAVLGKRRPDLIFDALQMRGIKFIEANHKKDHDLNIKRDAFALGYAMGINAALEELRLIQIEIKKQQELRRN